MSHTPTDTPHTPVPAAETFARLTLLPDQASLGVDEAGPPALVVASGAPRFEPIEQLGMGGVGQVLAVRDRDIGRRVAIKRMRDDRRSPGAVARFVQEVRTVGRLEHPNIVTVHDVGRDETGSFYFVMKLVDGETLETIIARLRAGDADSHKFWTFERRMDVFHQVVGAVRFAHHQGIVHRDLKPSNIMVGAHGEVTVVDWGLAKALDDPPDPAQAVDTWVSTSTSNTRAGALLGTPRYMAPEQASGEPATTATDVWALCLVLYEFVALKHPLDGLEDLDPLLDAIKNRPIMAPMYFPPHALQGKVPADISWILMAGLIRDPAKRLTIDALVDRLDRRRNGDIDAECLVTWQKRMLARMSRFVDGHPLVAMGGFVGGVLGMAALALAAVGGVVVGMVGVLV